MLGATLTLIYFNVFEMIGCVGLDYDVPVKHRSLVVANTFVVGQISMLATLELCMIRSGLVKYRDIVTLRLSARETAVAFLVHAYARPCVNAFAQRKLETVGPVV